MRPECVVPETQCAIKRKEKKAQKEKDKQQIPPSSATVAPVVTTTDTYKSEIPSLMKCEPPPHAECTVRIVHFYCACFPISFKFLVILFYWQQLLPQKLLEDNRARNVTALTFNQLAVIYKLIWYQDGYEQPSEEDLKRIMGVSIYFCSLFTGSNNEIPTLDCARRKWRSTWREFPAHYRNDYTYSTIDCWVCQRLTRIHQDTTRGSNYIVKSKLN